MSQFAEMTSLTIFYDAVFLLSSIVVGPSFMSISFLVLELRQCAFIRLTRNLEIVNTAIQVLFNISRLGQVMDTEFGTNVSNENATECCKIQGLQFLPFLSH